MTTQTPASPTTATSERPGTTVGWAPLAVVMVGTFVYVLDYFIVNVALPAIRTGLSVGAGTIEWVVAGYGLATAVSLITGGRLGDRYGRRRVFAIGLGGFVATSALCALAPTGLVLVLARLAQGLAAGLLAPNVLSIIGVVYSGRRRVRAISVYGMVMGLAATTGQLIGGLLLQLDIGGTGWRSIFWINVPIGLAALAAMRLIPESRDDRPGRVDGTGMLLIAAAVTALVLPLVEGSQHGWPAWSWVVLAAAVPLLVVFGRTQLGKARRGADPLVDLHVLAHRGPATGLTVQLLFWCQQSASYLFLALYTQQGRGVSPLASGGLFAMLAAGYLVTSSPAPALTARFGRNVILAGGLIAGVGDLVLAGTVWRTDAVLALLPGLFLLGAGQGLCITPLTATVLGFATPRTVGTLSGTLSTVQQIGNAVGVGVLGVVFFAVLPHGYADAFAVTSVAMAGLLAVVAGLTRLMGRPDGGHKAEEER